MTQRILVACCILLVLVSLGMAGLLWNQTEQARRMVAEQRAMAERQLADARATQQQMLKQLQELSKSVVQLPDARLDSRQVQAHAGDARRPARGRLRGQPREGERRSVQAGSDLAQIG